MVAHRVRGVFSASSSLFNSSSAGWTTGVDTDGDDHQPPVPASDRIWHFYDVTAKQPDAMAGRLFAALDALQYPANCSQARLFIKTHFAEYGFGMNMHQLAQNLIVTHDANRTLVTSPNTFRYAPLPECPDRSPDCFFENTSSCRQDNVPDASPLWFNPGELRPLARSSRRAFTFAYNHYPGAQAFRAEYDQYYRFPLADGETGGDEFAEHSRRQAELRGVPRWYWCHVVAYCFRPNRLLREMLRQRMNETAYGTDDFTVGLQIRGGNKKDDEQAGYVRPVMTPHIALVEQWLRRQPAYDPARSTVGIYLMTDSPDVIESLGNFSGYRFMFRDALDTRTEHTGSPVTFNDTVVIAVDTLLVAAADFFMGQYLSNLGRLPFELAVAMHPGYQNASDYGCLVKGENEVLHCYNVLDQD